MNEDNPVDCGDEGMVETVTLVAVSLTHPESWTPKQVQENLFQRLNQPIFRTLWGPWHVDCWWIAEDERHDGNDNDSAVFVPRTMTQQQARSLLVHGHAGVPPADGRAMDALTAMYNDAPDDWSDTADVIADIITSTGREVTAP